MKKSLVNFQPLAIVRQKSKRLTLPPQQARQAARASESTREAEVGEAMGANEACFACFRELPSGGERGGGESGRRIGVMEAREAESRDGRRWEVIIYRCINSKATPTTWSWVSDSYENVSNEKSFYSRQPEFNHTGPAHTHSQKEKK